MKPFPLLALAPLALLLLTHPSAAAEIPIRTVVLYKNGVGYFERAGDLPPGESARLDFKQDQMNDVLKSLTISDSGGKISGIRYDSSEPLAEKLAGFPFQVGEHASLVALFDQLKGARIELKYGAETASGMVLGARLEPASQQHSERQQLTLLADSGELRTFDLAAAASIRFADPKLQIQLHNYLAALNQARSKDLRGVFLDAAPGASAARHIAASYMLPTPVWKSSYRLIFGAAAEPTLEGWAIIDNTTGEDWTGVRMAVVSGRPVSFISNLYEARFVERQTASLPEDEAAAPALHEGGIGGAVGSGAESKLALAAAPRAGAAELFSRKIATLSSAQMVSVAPSGIAVPAATRDLGDLFEYRFSAPVTVKKDESAMLPFVQQPLAARRLLVYAESYGQHPLTAAELTNSTGKTLDGGPITVFDGGSYSGEALMETLKAGDKRLISYAVDLGARVTTGFDSSGAGVREMHVNRGLLTTRSAMEETKTYTIRNVDAKPKTVLIEHAVRPGYKLLNQKPSETTADAYRFEVKLGPAATLKFPVNEERLDDTTVSLSSLTPDALFAYLQNRALSEAARKQLRQIADLKRQTAADDSQVRALENDINELIRNQDRIRQNLMSLNQVSGQQEQVQTYSRQLAADEARLAALRDRLAEARKQKTALDAALRDAIERLEF